MNTTLVATRVAAPRPVLRDPAPHAVPLGAKPVPVLPRPPRPRPERAAGTVPARTFDDLLALPGAVYACAMLLEDGKVLVEAGRADGETRAAVRFLRAAARIALGSMAADPDDRLEDFIVTSTRCYDLVRQVRVPGIAGTAVLHLRVDRTVGNLAQARRRLADTAWPDTAWPDTRPPALPRRVPAAVPPPFPADDAAAGIPTGWANDLTVLRRLSAALRRSA